MSEGRNKAEIMLGACKIGFRLWRNNRGMFLTLDGKRKVRAGLEADKSGDLIGLLQVTITPEMVGRTLAVFSSIEVKPDGWKAPKNQHERDQAEFVGKVKKMGGFACLTPDINILQKEVANFIKAK
jgi:ribosomal protein S19